jgi:hypothetical protein
LGGRGHEFERDPVRVLEVEMVTERALLDAGMGDTLVIELAPPLFKLFFCGDVKADVIQADTLVGENVSRRRVSVLTQPQQLVPGEGEDRDVTDAFVALEDRLAPE